jgi:nitrite reductase/ring-hydroxylating ferredoxin subunit
MLSFIEAADLDRVAPGRGATVTIRNNTVAMFKTDSVIYAIEAWCLRCGACLAEGSLEGSIIACRGCDWRYDVTTGSVVGIRALRLNTFNVEVVGGKIIIANA